VAQVELVVAVGAEHERGSRVRLPRQQPHDVERGLVGPVQVLDDEDRRGPARELAQQRIGHLVRPGVARRGLRQVAAGLLGHVEQRTQRARREERIARSPQDPRRLAVLVGEASGQRGLAGPRLARDEHEPPARGSADAVEHRPERLERPSRSLDCASWVAGAVDTYPLMPPPAIVRPDAPAPQAG
jgi:hypothetical protein